MPLAPAEACWAHIVMKAMMPAETPLLEALRTGTPRTSPSVPRDEWQLIQSTHLTDRPLCNRKEIREIAISLGSDINDPTIQTRAQLEEAIKLIAPDRSPKKKPAAKAKGSPVNQMRAAELRQDVNYVRGLVHGPDVATDEARSPGLAAAGRRSVCTGSSSVPNVLSHHGASSQPTHPGAFLELRGPFWSCADFPACRGAMNYHVRARRQREQQRFRISTPSERAESPSSQVTGTMEMDGGMSCHQHALLQWQLARLQRTSVPDASQ